jgi:hypothetical protein
VRSRASVPIGAVALASLASVAFATRASFAAGAVESAAASAARGLGPVPGRSVVVAAPFESDEKAPKGDELALRVAAFVARTIGDGARPRTATADLARARAVADDARSLVFVTASVAGGDLRVTAFVYPVVRNVWDRVRSPLPAPTAHAFAAAKIDAEVRSFLMPLFLEQATVRHFSHGETGVLAAGCGDADGDGGNELLLVSRDRVLLGRLRDGAFAPDHAAAWADLAPRLPVPMREPLGGAVVGVDAVLAGSTDRGGVSLSRELRAPAAFLAGLPSWGGAGAVCLTAQPAAGAFDGAPIDCAPARDPKPAMAVPAPRFDAFAADNVASADGRVLPVVAVREPNGALRIRLGDATFTAGPVGASIAVSDLDQDGTPEIASTSAGPDEAIDVFDLDPTTGVPNVRLHVPLLGPVRALASCPPERDGAPALVAVTDREVWVLRATLGAPRVAR